MAIRNYILTVDVDGVEQSSLWEWNQRKAQLGHRYPWWLERVDGKIHLKHKEGQEYEVQPEMIQDEKPVKLPNVSDSPIEGVSFRLKPIEYLRAAYKEPTADVIELRQKSEIEVENDFWAFMCTNTWILDSDRLGEEYSGVSQRRRAFTVGKRGDSYFISLIRPEIRIEGIEVDEKIKDFTLSAEDLAKVRIRMGTTYWYFLPAQFPKVSAEEQKKIPRFVDLDTENRSFIRTFFGVGTALSILLILLLLSARFFKKDEPEKEDLKFAKIVLSTPPVTAPTTEGKTKEIIVESEQKIAAEAPPVKEAPPKAQAPEKSSAKVVAKGTPGRKAPPKKKVSQQLSKAQSLKKSLGSLFKGGKKKLLSKATPSRSAKANELFSSQGGTGQIPKRGAQVGSPNVGVKLTEGVAGGKKGATGYKSVSAKGSGTIAKGGSFVSVMDGAGKASYVEEGLTRDEVMAVIRKHMNEVRNCYEKSLLSNPELEGRTLVNFVVGANGNVVTSKVENSTHGEGRLDRCVLGRLDTWKFPRPKGRPNVKIFFPFSFRRI